jgi:hypothetical protein
MISECRESPLFAIPMTEISPMGFVRTECADPKPAPQDLSKPLRRHMICGLRLPLPVFGSDMPSFTLRIADLWGAAANIR